MLRFVQKANAAMKNATFAQWPQNTSPASYPLQVNSGLLWWCNFCLPSHSFPTCCFLQGAVLGWLWRWRSGLCLTRFNDSWGLGILGFFLYIGYICINICTYLFSIKHNTYFHVQNPKNINITWNYVCLYICQSLGLIVKKTYIYIYSLGFARSAKKYEKGPWHWHPVGKAKGQARREGCRCFQW